MRYRVPHVGSSRFMHERRPHAGDVVDGVQELAPAGDVRGLLRRPGRDQTPVERRGSHATNGDTRPGDIWKGLSR